MARQALDLQPRMGPRTKAHSVADSLIPLVAMGVVAAVASLLVTILLTSPNTHANLLR